MVLMPDYRAYPLSFIMEKWCNGDLPLSVFLSVLHFIDSSAHSVIIKAQGRGFHQR